jgi:uncharacterized membrane protein YukC
MDEIDITISNQDFSLENIQDLNEIISNVNDYTIFMYIAIILSVLIFGFVFYKIYINNQKHVKFQDSDECFGDVCYR